MNIGVFTDTYYPIINGVTTSAMMLDRELTALGHNVTIFTTTVPKTLNIRSDPRVVRLPSMPFVFMPQNRMALMYPPRLLLGMKKFNLDVIHTQTEFPLGIFGKLVSKVYGIPLVHTYHTMYEDYTHYIAKGYIVTPEMMRRYSRIFCNASRAVIAPVAKARDALLSYGVTRPISVIPTGIDFSPFDPANHPAEETLAIKAALGVPPEAPVMIFIGRLAKEKSVDVIIGAMPEIIRRIPDIRLVIVGDGAARKSLETQAAALGVAGRVIFAGARPWSQIGKYYQLGDVYVCASTSETQGLTYIEAIASRVPVVAKRDESVAGIITDGETGFYFGDNAELPGAVEKALSPGTGRADIAGKAFAAIARFSSKEFGENVEALYIETLRRVAEETGADKSPAPRFRLPRLGRPKLPKLPALAPARLKSSVMGRVRVVREGFGKIREARRGKREK